MPPQGNDVVDINKPATLSFHQLSTMCSAPPKHLDNGIDSDSPLNDVILGSQPMFHISAGWLLSLPHRTGYSAAALISRVPLR
jgi:hypothetical protein